MVLGRTASSTVLAAMLALASPAAALAPPPWQPKPAAGPDAMQQGLAAEKAGDWVKAAEAFRKAVAEKGMPLARYHLGLSESRLGRTVEAVDELEQAEKDAAARKQKDVQGLAQKLLAQLKDKVGLLTVYCEHREGLVVTVDGKEIPAASFDKPMRVKAGDHMVTALLPGGEPLRRNVSVPGGGTATVEMEPSGKKRKVVEEGSAEPSSGSGQRTMGWIGIGVGAVGVGVGVVYGMQAKSARDELKGSCADNICPPDKRETYDRGKRAANISTAAFVVGAVGLAAGTVLLLTAKDDKAPESRTAGIRPVVAPPLPGMGGGLVGVEGRF